MNDVQLRNILDTFENVGFDKVEEQQLRLIAHHYTKAKGKIMIVISHSTTHDFLLGLLLFGRTKMPTTMFTNFKNPFLTMFANNLGMITHQAGKSNTQAIIEKLKTKKNFAFLISLARTAPKQKIQSGYFYIAQALQVPIIVVGFDYYLKTGYVSPKWIAPPTKTMTYADFKEQFEPLIVDHLKQICPAKPHFQVAFDVNFYKHAHPEFSMEKIFIPDMKRLYAHVAGNYIPTNVWVIVLAVSLLLLILITIMYFKFYQKIK